MWFWYALTAAFVGAVENYFNKRALKTVRPILMSWSGYALSLPLICIYVFLTSHSKVNILFFIGTIGSSVVYAGAKVMKNNSFKNSDLSKIIPLTSFGSLFTYFFGLIFLSEKINTLGLLGLIFIIVGTYILNVEKAREHILEPIKILIKDKDSFIYLIAMILSSISAIFDKTGVINTFPTNAALVLFAENIFMTVILTLLLIYEKGWTKELRKNFWTLNIYSIIYSITSLLVFLSFAGGPVALAQGVKRLELLFTLILSYIFFNDRPPKYAWIATVIMILGIVLIKVA